MRWAGHLDSILDTNFTTGNKEPALKPTRKQNADGSNSRLHAHAADIYKSLLKGNRVRIPGKIRC
jgi:hypothetical protein